MTTNVNYYFNVKLFCEILVLCLPHFSYVCPFPLYMFQLDIIKSAFNIQKSIRTLVKVTFNICALKRHSKTAGVQERFRFHFGCLLYEHTRYESCIRCCLHVCFLFRFRWPFVCYDFWPECSKMLKNVTLSKVPECCIDLGSHENEFVNISHFPLIQLCNNVCPF